MNKRWWATPGHLFVFLIPRKGYFLATLDAGMCLFVHRPVGRESGGQVLEPGK